MKTILKRLEELERRKALVDASPAIDDRAELMKTLDVLAEQMRADPDWHEPTSEEQAEMDRQFWRRIGGADRESEPTTKEWAEQLGWCLEMRERGVASAPRR